MKKSKWTYGKLKEFLKNNTYFDLVGDYQDIDTVVGINSKDTHTLKCHGMDGTCNNLYQKPLKSVVQGLVKSCGCYKIIRTQLNNCTFQEFKQFLLANTYFIDILDITDYSQKITRSNIYRLLCRCGNIRIGDLDAILYGLTKSCGCYNRQIVGALNRNKNPTLKEFKQFLLEHTYFINVDIPLKEDEHLPNMYTQKYWFYCRCGKKVFTTAGLVWYGQTKSCECYKKEKIKEAIKNKNPTVAEFKEFIRNNTQFVDIITNLRDDEHLINLHVAGIYKLLCICDNIVSPSLTSVLSLNNKSCGCLVPVITQSQAEKDIIEWLLSLNIQDIINNDRTMIKPHELDIYIPSKKLAIEYCGLYWHGESKNKYLNKTKHLYKYLKCKEIGIDLITIFEDEWINKKEIVKNIIKSKLNITNNIIIGARKCRVSRCELMEIREFLTQNHLQETGNGGICYKLMYNDIIVACITFSHATLSKGIKLQDNNYELNRYCTKSNYQIIGGFSKLLNTFIKEYKPKQIISYSDNRYFNGKIYERTNFKFDKLTRPSYSYYIQNSPHKRINRFNFRKDILISKYGADPSKTEWEIMQELGYDRIWDCGNKKWVLEL